MAGRGKPFQIINREDASKLSQYDNFWMGGSMKLVDRPWRMILCTEIVGKVDVHEYNSLLFCASTCAPSRILVSLCLRWQPVVLCKGHHVDKCRWIEAVAFIWISGLVSACMRFLVVGKHGCQTSGNVVGIMLETAKVELNAFAYCIMPLVSDW